MRQAGDFLHRYPQYRWQFIEQYVVDPKALAKFADRLPEGTAAVQYFAAPDRLYIFVVAAGGQFHVRSRGVSQGELYAMVKEYRQLLERASMRRLRWIDDGSEDYRRDVVPLKEVGKRLSEHLLGPIKSELSQHAKLIVIPNDLLLYVPIHALPIEAEDGTPHFLAETHMVSYLTGLELPELLSQETRAREASLLAIGNPDGTLPAASREIRALAQLRPGVTVLDGAEATKARFIGLAGKFMDIHLATHAVLDSKRPEESYLVMGGKEGVDRMLRVNEVAGLRLQSGVAVLSACDTALGEEVPGAALVTLAAAFSLAGSQSIVASLWKVNDEATRDLMVEFHRTLSAAGPALAMQKAQVGLLRKVETGHPYYWAPFVVFGAR